MFLPPSILSCLAMDSDNLGETPAAPGDRTEVLHYMI